MRRKGAPDARGQGGPRMRDRDVRVLGLHSFAYIYFYKFAWARIAGGEGGVEVDCCEEG